MDNNILGMELTETQMKMLGKMLDPEVNRLIVSAYTRYGKTQVCALATLIYVLDEEDKRVALIGPQYTQVNELRRYIAEKIAEVPQLTHLVDSSHKDDPSRLKKEVSKKRITFKNGCEINILSAEGTGNRLMGKGADFIVLDECALMDDEVFEEKISRMLGDNPENSQLIELLNPWNRENFAWKHWNSDRFVNIQVPYTVGIEEGRTTEEFIEEQREELSDYAFTVLYESTFPDSTKEGLFKFDWINQGMNHTFEDLDGSIEKIWGLDVARGGEDYTVLTKTEQVGGLIRVTEQMERDMDDVMKIVNFVMDEYNKEDDVKTIRVDTIGVGSGVFDRLAEKGAPVEDVMVSRGPRDKEQFRNQKAEVYWELRNKFESGNISIPKDTTLRNQLLGISTDRTAGGKLKIEDPPKSPDRADSMMLCMPKADGKKRTGSDVVAFDKSTFTGSTPKSERQELIEKYGGEGSEI